MKINLKHLLVTSALALGSLGGCTGTYPTDLGVNNGLLTPCPASPNCVNSQAVRADKSHFIPALEYIGTAENAYSTVVSTVQTMEGSKITEIEDRYLRVTFTTPLMGFVDDVEFYFPEQPLIHVRSASRKGYSDFGINRKRIETLRSMLEKALEQAKK